MKTIMYLESNDTKYFTLLKLDSIEVANKLVNTITNNTANDFINTIQNILSFDNSKKLLDLIVKTNQNKDSFTDMIKDFKNTIKFQIIAK